MIWIDFFTALGLGILTAIHPCLLVLTMMALTAIYGAMETSRSVLFRAMSFVTGRIVIYTGIGCFFAAGSIFAPNIARLFKYYTDVLIGPIFILMGMIMADFLFNTMSRYHENIKKRAIFSTVIQKGGLFLLGAFHTLLFCPVTAGLFFGIVIPLADTKSELVWFCFVYGIGSGIPIIMVVLVSVFGTGVFFLNKKRHHFFLVWYPKISGGILIVFGCYLTLHNIFQVI